MTMHFHNGAIYYHIFKIGIFTQHVENARKRSPLGPASKSLKHRIPVPEFLWQIAPGRSGSCYPQHRFQKQPTVASRLPSISHFSQTIRLDRLPLCIVQYLAYQDSISNSFFFPPSSLPTPYLSPLNKQPK